MDELTITSSAHPRFGGTPTADTLKLIDCLTEWVEEQTEPFTVMDAFKATGRGSYNTVYKVIRELRDQDLLQQTNPNAKPARWIYRTRAAIPVTELATAPLRTDKHNNSTLTPHKLRLKAAGISHLQLDILVLVAQGASNLEIALRTGRSEDTIKTHLRRVFAAIGARDRAHAVAIAYRLGLFLDDPNSKEPCHFERTADAVAQTVKVLLYDDLTAKIERLDRELVHAHARLDTVSATVLSAVLRTA